MTKKHIGQKIRLIRERQHISLVKLASDSKITAAYLSELENGVKNNPSFNVLSKLASALGISVAELLDEPKTKAVGE